MGQVNLVSAHTFHRYVMGSQPFKSASIQRYVTLGQMGMDNMF